MNRALTAAPKSALARAGLFLALLFTMIAGFALMAGCANEQGQGGSEASGEAATEAASEEAAPTGNVLLDTIAKMTLEEKVAQLFVVTPEDISPDSAPLTLVDDKVKSDMAALPVPGGFCYFADNISNPEQVRSLLADMQAEAEARNGLVLLQAVDEEGGEVARLADVKAMGVHTVDNASIIGAKGDPEAAYEAASYISSYLRDFGFNTDFAPVCDIANGVGNTMGRRAFDSTAEGVVPMVEAQVKAFKEAGILCSAKHFPGIGYAAGDSHDGAIETTRSLEDMRESEFLPFKAAIEQGVPMVMVGHVSCPELTGDDTPASLSPQVIGDVLRGELGYDGVVVTDSLAMGAATDAFAEEELALRAIQAGADIALMPTDYKASMDAVVKAVQAGELSEEEIDAHVKRVLKMKFSLMGIEVPEDEVVGGDGAAGEADGEADGDAAGAADDGAVEESDN